MEADNKPLHLKPIKPSKTSPGNFPYREDDDACTYFATYCHVNRQQLDADYNVCEEFCIPQRKHQGDNKELVEA